MTPIRLVLCPVDFSESSARCLAHAAALARWRQARLSVLHVESPIVQRLPHTRAQEWTDPGAHQSDHERIRREMEALFAAVGEPADRADLIVDLGQPVSHILSRAAALGADLIVLGTHGLGGFRHLVLGSVAEKVLRRAPCDVLVVPPQGASTARLPYASIVCGVDFSVSSQRALDVACELAVDSGAGLTVVHVIGWPWDESASPDFAAMPPEQATALAEYRRYLETTAATRLRDLLGSSAAQPARCTAVVRHGRSHRELLGAARDSQADLIVVGGQGHGAVSLAMFGSTASQVAREASCPVWIARVPGS
jgi:nucleotide-binding universal stress UspA family protein